MKNYVYLIDRERERNIDIINIYYYNNTFLLYTQITYITLVQHFIF